MAKYIIQGETLKAIADEVRDLTDITNEINPNEMIANMEQVNADVAAQTEIIEQIRTALDGKAGSNAAEIGAIIDNSGVLDSTEGTVEEKVEQLIDKAVDDNLWYIASGKITNFASGRDCPCFTQWAYSTLPKTDFSNTTSLSYGIYNTQLEYIDFYINSAKCTNFGDALSFNKKLKWIVGVDLSSATTIFDLFLACNELETIQEPLNIAKVTKSNNAFVECFKLKDIRFVAECIKVSITFESSSALTADSTQSIFDGLATVETAQILTLNANLKILQSQVDSANAKGWTVAGGTVVSEEEYYG